MLSLRCLLRPPNRGLHRQLAGYMGLEFRREVWAGNTDLRVIRVEMRFDVLGLDEIPWGATGAREDGAQALTPKEHQG